MLNRNQGGIAGHGLARLLTADEHLDVERALAKVKTDEAASKAARKAARSEKRVKTAAEKKLKAEATAARNGRRRQSRRSRK